MFTHTCKVLIKPAYVSALSQLRAFTVDSLYSQNQTGFKPPPRHGLQTGLEGDLFILHAKTL